MALLFSPSISQLYLHRVISDFGLGGSIVIYQGAMPTVAEYVANFNPTYNGNNANTLAVFNGFSFTHVQTNYLGMTSFPGNITAARTGTASWGAIFNSNNYNSTSSISGNIPSTHCIIFTVTGSGGDGVVRLSTTSLIAGTTFQVVDAGFITSTT